jgi:hypothetical protein
MPITGAAAAGGGSRRGAAQRAFRQPYRAPTSTARSYACDGADRSPASRVCADDKT